MAKQTYTAAERKAQFLKAGLAIAKKDGIAKVSVAAVAAKCKVTAPLVFHSFGTRDALQAAIKREATKQKVKLAEPKKAARKAPARKRSVAEVRAIKDKAAGKKITTSKDGLLVRPKPTKNSVPKKVAAKKSVGGAAGKTTTPSPRKQPTQKYAPNPVPQVAMPAEPKALL
jgi:hypothetical protein